MSSDRAELSDYATNTAYEKGFRARQRGMCATTNPYRQTTAAWFDWADGWKDLDEHIRERDAALRFTFGASHD